MEGPQFSKFSGRLRVPDLQMFSCSKIPARNKEIDAQARAAIGEPVEMVPDESDNAAPTQEEASKAGVPFLTQICCEKNENFKTQTCWIF